MHNLRTVLLAVLLGAGFAARLDAQITTPPDGYWNDYREITRGWLDEFNTFRSERGLPVFVWSEKMYVCLVEYANECRSHNLDIKGIPGPCERPTQRARRVHRWNLYFFDNYTVFLKAAYTAQEAVKSVASVAIIKSIHNPRNNAAAVAIVERNAEEVYIIMSTAAIDIEPVLQAHEALELRSLILESPQATPADRLTAMKELAALKNFELSFTFAKYLLDRDAAVARAAAEGLNALADPSAVCPLVRALATCQPDAREAVAAALARITGRKDLGADPEKWRKWYESSGGAVTKPFEVPEAAVSLPEEEIKKIIEDFKIEAKNPDATRRMDAVRQVGRIKHPDIAEEIAKLLADKDPLVRKTAAEALVYQAEKGTLKQLAAAAPLNKNHPEVLAPVIRALGAIGDYRALPIVTKDLMKPGEGEVTRARLEALGNIRHPDSIDTLIEFGSRWGRGLREFAQPLQDSLKKLTGLDFGRNMNAWKSWWDRKKPTFRFPPEEKKD